MGASDGKKEAVIDAVYKLNLHCKECAHAIEKWITRTSGVQKVGIDVESGKVTVKGAFDPKKMHELIGKKSRRNVEWISPKPKESEKAPEKKQEEKKKEEVIKTTVVKIYMHCERCERDLNRKLVKHRGIHSVKTDRELETCTVVGTIEEKELIEYIRKMVGKHGEIVPQKQEKKEKEVEKKDKEVEKKASVQVKEVKEYELKVDVVEKKEEIKSKDVVMPYFIHCTHAPQWFSEENPNACFIM